MKRCVVTAGFVAFALFVSACAGSSDTDSRDTGAPVPAANQSEPSAAGLIAALGSEQAATDALIIAMDRGYSGPQILDAVDTNKLRSDGTIEDQDPAGPALGLVLYDVTGQGQGAFGPDDSTVGQVQLASFLQIEKTPIERLRGNASKNLGVGEPATDLILRLLKAGFEAADVIEILILGIDESADHPEEPDGPIPCVRIVDEIYCPSGERFPAPADSDADQDESAPAEESTAPTEQTDTRPMQLLWEGEMTPIDDFVPNPIAGTYKLTRTAGSDDFQIRLSTTDAKTGTFTTDGFDSVECTSQWSSVFEGTGTFWDVNDLGIEFDGQITRSRVYTAGPCDSVLLTETSDFSGVVVFVTDTGIEASFNAWNFSAPGSAPSPIS